MKTLKANRHLKMVPGLLNHWVTGQTKNGI